MSRRSPPRSVPAGTYPTARGPGTDERSAAQRRHDGIELGLKADNASCGLRSHRGHPISVIVRPPGRIDQDRPRRDQPDIPMPPTARTGGDTALPMRDDQDGR